MQKCKTNTTKTNYTTTEHYHHHMSYTLTSLLAHGHSDQILFIERGANLAVNHSSAETANTNRRAMHHNMAGGFRSLFYC